MTLRAKILTYLVLLHLILAGLSVPVLIDQPNLLFAFEALFALSLIVGILLMRAFFVPLQLIRTGTKLMNEQDFSTSFREVGQPEMDALIRIYNRMVDQLRNERLQTVERDRFVDKILQASPTAVIVLDHDGTIAEVNRRGLRLLGPAPAGVRADVDGIPGAVPVAAGSWTGLRLSQLAEAATGTPAAKALADSLSHLGPDESTILAFEGGKLRCRRAEFFDRGSKRSFFLLDELTEELRESEKLAYGKVIRMMSHEVHNSVGSVRSLLESCGIYREQLASDDRDDYGQALSVAADRLSHLNTFMNGLASVVRVPEPDRRPCELQSLLRDLVLLMQPELTRREIEIVWEGDRQVRSVSIDKNQIEQVLVNLLRNAVEAIDNNGSIVLATGRNAGRIWLAVRDTGCGLDEEVRAGLLQPFFSNKRDGQGVGLTLAREILARHGCRFSLENRAEQGAEALILF